MKFISPLVEKQINELLVIQKEKINDEEINAIDARKLHEFLEVGDRFEQWINRRIKKYKFIINSDFCTIQGESSGGRKPTEYIITTDMAKELSMVENNEKGRIARKYFIDCEKKLKGIQASLPNFDDPIAAAKAWIAEKEKTIALEQETKKQSAEIEYKQNMINGLTKDISLAEKRKILNRVVRHKNADFRERWRILYREFEDAHRMNIKIRIKNYQKKYNTKISKIEYIDKVLNMLPELYNIGCKIFNTDVDELINELYNIK